MWLLILVQGVVTSRKRHAGIIVGLAGASRSERANKSSKARYRDGYLSIYPSINRLLIVSPVSDQRTTFT